MNDNVRWTDDDKVYEKLPDGARVIFRLGEGQVSVRADNETLIVSGIGRIAVHPKAANLIRVTVEP